MAEMSGWQTIETAPLGQMVWLWGPLWRHAFPGRRNGDNGAVYVDTCEPEAKGWQSIASHWMPLPALPIERSSGPIATGDPTWSSIAKRHRPE